MKALRHLKTVFKKRLRILWLIPACLMLYIICEIIGICRYSNVDETRSADVAVVLGASTCNGVVSPVYKERINHAVLLYQNQTVRKLILTGGMGEGNQKSDAYTAREYAVSQGVKREDILIEESSTITQENLENAKKLMDDNDLKTALIVSDPLHMKRAMLLSEDAGMDSYSSPTATSCYRTLKTKIPFVARETFFYIGYKFCRFFGIVNG